MSRVFSISKALSNPENVATLRKHDVIYVDRGLIAVNKPSGIVTQGTINTHKKQGTIQVALDDIRGALGLKEGPFTVHRLDKQTTGLLVLAPTTVQAKTLSKAFARLDSSDKKAGLAVKKYLALVHTKSFRRLSSHSRILRWLDGSPKFGVKESINIDLYINGDGCVSLWDDKPSGSDMLRKRSALTDMELLALSPRYPIALVGLQLHTGIKHQLRVTLGSFSKVPILGDDRYGTHQDKTVLPTDLLPPDTLMLHSSSLEIQRYRNKSGFSPFGISAPPPSAFLLACERSGIFLPDALSRGGISIDGSDMTSTLRLQERARTDINDNDTGFWLLD